MPVQAQRSRADPGGAGIGRGWPPGVSNFLGAGNWVQSSPFEVRRSTVRYANLERSLRIATPACHSDLAIRPPPATRRKR